MNVSEIITLVCVVLSAALYGVMMYFRVKGNATSAATELIALIEQSGLLGKEKMAYVVEELFRMIPAPFKSVFTEDRLETLAQEIFDNMKDYALEYIGQHEKKEDEQKADEQEAGE